MRKEIFFSKPQLDFVKSNNLVSAFVGAWGAGKTVTNIHKAIQNRLLVPREKYIVEFYEPSHALLQKAAYPTLRQILPLYGLIIGKNCTFIGNPKVLTIKGYGEIRFSSLTDPTQITGANTVSHHIDECDRIREDVMTEAFNQLFGRFRVANEDLHFFEDLETGEYKISRVNFTSTPEGFGFLYKHFHPDVIGDKYPERTLIKADIWSNPFIDVETFVQQNAHLPEELKRAYFNAEFVNMQSGSVYKEFSRELHVTDENIRIQHNYDVFVGCDFNIQHMAAVIAVKDQQQNIIVVDEVVDAYDTDDLIRELKKKISHFSRTEVFPDASGRNRHSSSATSDIGLLQQAGFKDVTYNNEGNPRVRDTINLINIAFLGKRVKITKNCNKLISALEQQTYDKKGEPDKSKGIDHVLDSFRYLCWHSLQETNKTVLGYRKWGL